MAVEFTRPVDVQRLQPDPTAPPLTLVFYREDSGEWRPEMDIRMPRAQAVEILLAVTAQLCSVAGLGPLPDGPPNPYATQAAMTAIHGGKVPQLLHAIADHLSTHEHPPQVSR